MKLKFFSLFFFFLSSFSWTILHGYSEENDAEFLIESKRDYQDTVRQMIGDLHVMRPSLLMNFCKILDLEEDGLSKTLYYYQQQYKSLAAGFSFVLEVDSNFVYLLEFIEHDLEKEQNTFNNATTCKTKTKCLNNIYNGLLGSAMITNRILDGQNFSQLYKASKKLVSPNTKSHL